MIARNVYTEYEMARRNAIHKMNLDEQDIFVCQVKFPSGVEFVLKTECEMISGGEFLYHLRIPFRHKFNCKHAAVRESGKFETPGKPVGVERHTITEGGYEKTSHYSLCLI